MFKKLTLDKERFHDKRGEVDLLYESKQLVLKRSFSLKGVFRGLHRQTFPYLQTKIIRVISGKILDFVSNPDDKEQVVWFTEISPSDDWIVIDKILAHGFYALEDSVFEYICEGEYKESYEESYRIDHLLRDELGIEELLISDKDLNGKRYGMSLQDFSSN